MCVVFGLPRFLKTLNTNPKTTHTKCKTLYISCKMLLCFQNNVMSPQKGILFLKWHTQTIIWVYISKHQLNTDVLNGKHYYEWENTSMKALSGTLWYYTLTPVVKYNCIMFLRKYKTTHKYNISLFFPKVL